MPKVHTFWPKASISSTELSLLLVMEANETSWLVTENNFSYSQQSTKSFQYHHAVFYALSSSAEKTLIKNKSKLPHYSINIWEMTITYVIQNQSIPSYSCHWVTDVAPIPPGGSHMDWNCGECYPPAHGKGKAFSCNKTTPENTFQK